MKTGKTRPSDPVRRAAAAAIASLLVACGGDPGVTRVDPQAAVPAPTAASVVAAEAPGNRGAFTVVVDGGRVGIEAEGARLGDVLTALAAKFDVEVHAAGPLDRAISVSIHGSAFEPAVARLLGERGYAVRYGAQGSPPLALYVFGYQRRDPGLAALDLSLTAADPATRAGAVVGLSAAPAGLDTGGLLERLDGALADGSPVVRDFAVAALAEAGGDEALAMLAPLLQDADPEVRQSAVHALAALDGARSQALLQAALRDPSTDVRQIAAAALAERRLLAR